MNDLFASLVDRALDRTPVLQRRQPTLFEPAIDAAFSERSRSANAMGLEEKESIVESEPSAHSKQFSTNTVRSPQLSSTVEEPELPALEPRHPRRRRTPDNPTVEEDVQKKRFEPVSAAPVKETKAAKPEELNRDVKPFPEPKVLPLTPERKIETIVEKTVEREIIKEQSTEPAIKEVHTFTQQNVQPQRLHRDEGKRAEQPSKAEVKHLPPPKEATLIKPLVPKNSVRYPAAAPTMRTASRAEARRPAAQPAPVIHVTIGRVEVRATTPAAGKPKSARSVGPKLSLDDYLRSRGKGTK